MALLGAREGSARRDRVSEDGTLGHLCVTEWIRVMALVGVMYCELSCWAGRMRCARGGLNWTCDLVWPVRFQCGWVARV